MRASPGTHARNESASLQRQLRTGLDEANLADDRTKQAEQRQALLTAHVSPGKTVFLKSILSAQPGTGADNQRQRILAALAKFPLTTLEVRYGLDVLEVAARIWELRHLYGCDIDKIMLDDVAENGKAHRVALYYKPIMVQEVSL